MVSHGRPPAAERSALALRRSLAEHEGVDDRVVLRLTRIEFTEPWYLTFDVKLQVTEPMARNFTKP